MKKNFLLFSAIFMASLFFAFTWNTNSVYDGLLDDERKQEFVKTTSSLQLKTNLAEVFWHDFDEVDQVDLHKNEKGNYYYYMVYGQKKGSAFAQIIHITKEMALAQAYPSRKDLGIPLDELVINCYWQEKEETTCDHNQTKHGVCGVARDDMSPCIQAMPYEPKPIDIDN